jgi:hypothetical protein
MDLWLALPRPVYRNGELVRGLHDDTVGAEPSFLEKVKNW